MLYMESTSSNINIINIINIVYIIVTIEVTVTVSRIDADMT